MSEKQQQIEVAGVKLAHDDPRVTSIRELKDVKKLHIFGHIKKADEKDAAEEEFFNQVSQLPGFKAIGEEDSESRTMLGANRLAELRAKNPDDLTEKEIDELDSLENPK